MKFITKNKEVLLVSIIGSFIGGLLVIYHKILFKFSSYSFSLLLIIVSVYLLVAFASNLFKKKQKDRKYRNISFWERSNGRLRTVPRKIYFKPKHIWSYNLLKIYNLIIIFFISLLLLYKVMLVYFVIFIILSFILYLIIESLELQQEEELKNKHYTESGIALKKNKDGNFVYPK